MTGPHEIAHLFDVPVELIADEVCDACGHPFRPRHDISSPGPTSRHPYRARKPVRATVATVPVSAPDREDAPALARDRARLTCAAACPTWRAEPCALCPMAEYLGES